MDCSQTPRPPIAVEVYPGNSTDSATVPSQDEKSRDRFGLQRVVLVGDRGTLTSTQIDVLRRRPGIDWIFAPDFPGERLDARYNPASAKRRAAKREELLQTTERRLARLQANFARRRENPLDDAAAGERLGAVKNKYKFAKPFEFEIEAG